MDETAQIQCPFCGQNFELSVDTSEASQQLIVDCEICCRPLEVRVACEEGEILSVEVRAS
jgi:hypothetical protein